MKKNKFWAIMFALSCGIASTFILGLNMLLTLLNDKPVLIGELPFWTMPLYFSIEGYFEVPIAFLGTFLLIFILSKTFLKFKRKEGIEMGLE